jgi:DnaK suppressor protein
MAQQSAQEESRMNEGRAKELLGAERRRVEDLLAESRAALNEDRSAEDERGGGLSDPAAPITAEGNLGLVRDSLVARLDAIERAEQRLAEGTYGKSLQSGEPIPDERLEADPAAELTVAEASARR